MYGHIIKFSRKKIENEGNVRIIEDKNHNQGLRGSDKSLSNRRNGFYFYKVDGIHQFLWRGCNYVENINNLTNEKEPNSARTSYIPDDHRRESRNDYGTRNLMKE